MFRFKEPSDAGYNVEQILRLLAQGMTTDEIRENYPHLKDGDIQAVLDYAGDRVADEEVYHLAEYGG